MSRFIRLDDKILKRICIYLRLDDLVTLRSVNPLLEEFLHKHPDIWTTGNNLCFLPNDATITDDYIRRHIPNIPRSYALREMKLINLPLTWTGFLWIFDHFAHSVDRIHVKASEQTLTDLARHLSIFAGNLAVLQHENKIPITFRQYAINHTQYENTMVQSDYMGRSNLKGLRRYLETLKLDDPPFEQLAELYIECTDPSPSSSSAEDDASSPSSIYPHHNENNPIYQIYFIASFLAGGHSLSRQSRPNNKRAREEEEDYHDDTSTTTTSNNNASSSASTTTTTTTTTTAAAAADLPVVPSSSSSTIRNNKYRRHDNGNKKNNNNNDTAVLPPPTTSSVHHTQTQPPLGYT
ncbi:hypothetical protein BDA99DRAFT_517713 [Phascolomyces articulosus]|uniref:F-box domain-containing protein n=1 Tax=Phascolomyces articulosus TaxID=60185 RepID=A0AAD5K8N2_9FUNG|nr:hypothetical protein BDA99DRAFT_517713 [Phascolomyces articulosus]